MAEWVTPIVDRTEADTVEAFNNQMIEERLKGALNFSDLNRIENNFKYLVDNLAKQGYYINHKYRNYTEREAVVTKVEKPGGGGGTSAIVDSYLQSSGTQWIDTEYIPKTDDLRIETQFLVTEIQAWRAIFGSEATGSGPWSITPLMNGSSALTFFAGTSESAGNIPIVANQDYALTCHMKDGKLTYNCGNNSGTLSVSGSVNKQNSIYLFTLNSSSSGNITGQTTKTRFHYFRIYDGGTLARDFIPKLDDNNVACLYDKVESKYYYNAGSGSFTYGENVYTPAEWIESNGTQCIDTKFTPNNNSRVVLDLQLLSNADVPFVFGTWAGSISQAMSVYWFTSTYNSWGSDYGTSRSKHSQTNWNKRLVIDANKNILTIDGISETRVAQTFTSPATLTLLGLNSPSGINTSYRAKAKVYSCQIYDNDILVRDFIPVIDSSGVALLYDRLNGVPYYNAGSGSFAFKRLAGQAEYIESTGTQYIDTGFKPNNNTRVVMDVEGSSTQTAVNMFFGVAVGSVQYYCGKASASNWNCRVRLGAQTGDHTNSDGTTYAKRKVIDLDKNVFGIDGETVTITASTFSVDLPLSLFGYNKDGVYGSLSQMKLYSCKIYDNDVLVRDYVPYVDDDGVVCLFDKVSQTYFYNAGSGTFNAGAPIAKNDGDVEYEYIVEYIDQLYTEWFEQNIPWKSEVDRIRRNFNNLLKEYLYGKRITSIPYTQYFKFTEANKLEDISASTKQTLENMIAEYRYCGTVNSGGDRLL